MDDEDQTLPPEEDPDYDPDLDEDEDGVITEDDEEAR